MPAPVSQMIVNPSAPDILLAKDFRFLRLEFFCSQNATVAKRGELFQLRCPIVVG